MVFVEFVNVVVVFFFFFFLCSVVIVKVDGGCGRWWWWWWWWLWVGLMMEVAVDDGVEVVFLVRYIILL